MSQFRKNIRYTMSQDDNLIDRFIQSGREDPRYFSEMLLYFQKVNGDAGLAEIVSKCLHHLRGVQFIVQKQLSDELVHVDFDNADFESLEWPATSIEFYYEDPALPTILVNHSPDNGLLIELARAMFGPNFRQKVSNWESWGEAALGALCDNATELTCCTITHDRQRWQQALASGRHEPMGNLGTAKLMQNDAETVELHQMLNLSLKVLAYSAIPAFKPVSVTRKQMGYGPKAGVAGRPARPSFRTVYLPRIVTPTADRDGAADGQESGPARTFLGRRGHIRHLNSEYFKKMRGQWIYVPPIIVAGATPEMRYKVRKV